MRSTTPERIAPKTVQILVVEDESVIAADIKDCLENLGYAVPAIAVSGETAVDMATSIRPDLVLMDIRLKGEMDGIQAAAHIWHHLRIPVVYSTGHSDRSTMERAKATGPFGYVLKPVEEQELYVAIETALQRFCLDRELQQREQWLASILRAIGDGVIVVDAQRRVKFLNPVAEVLTGWRQEEAIGRDIAEVFNIVHEESPSPMSNAINKVLQTNTLVHLTSGILLVSRDNRSLPIADSIAAFQDDNGTITGAVIVFRDITQQRLAEEHNLAIARSLQLESQMAELQSLSQLKDDFLNTVSHELRTPLTNIKMAIRMLELTLNQCDSTALIGDLDTSSSTRYLKILRDQCDRQASLINDLLDLQRLNADAYTLDLSTIYLQSWLPDLVANFQERMLSQQQQWHIDIVSDMPPIMTDAFGLSRIFTELVNNAIKYTPGGERISITVQPCPSAASIAAPAIQIQVCNSGVEIPQTELPRIFEQFYRIPSADRWQQGGTGLGLTLMKKLVNHLGGSIQVSSGQGETCFTVALPVDLSNRLMD